MAGRQQKNPRFWYELGKRWLKAREQGVYFNEFAQTVDDYHEATLRKKLKKLGFNLDKKK